LLAPPQRTAAWNCFYPPLSVGVENAWSCTSMSNPHVQCNKNQAVEISKSQTGGDVGVQLATYFESFLLPLCLSACAFCKFLLLQFLVPDVYYARTPMSLLIWRKTWMNINDCYESTAHVFDRRTKVEPVLADITDINS
jgi:hypothetical protein